MSEPAYPSGENSLRNGEQSASADENSGCSSVSSSDADAGSATNSHVPSDGADETGSLPPPPPENNTGQMSSSEHDSEGSLSTTAGSLPDTGEASSRTETEEDEDDLEKCSMPLLDHLSELRSRIFKALVAVAFGFLVCYGFETQTGMLFEETIRPLRAVMPADAKMIYTSLPQMFFLQLKLALLAGCFLASPAIFYQIWAFIAPGLYASERRHVVPLALVSAVFFIVGAAFCYCIVLPYAFAFFLSYSTEIVVAMPDVGIYFSFVLKLVLAFGLIFEMPLFAFFLSRMGILSARMMRRTRKYAVLCIFIAAAILTPPDVLSQLLMAGPMLILYEVSILVAAICGRKKAVPAQEEAGSGESDTKVATDEESDTGRS